MIDAEVARLRKLRNMALRVRAVAAIVSAHPTMQRPTVAVSAVIAWRLTRVVSGRLRAHPNLSFQQGPSSLRYFFHRALAIVIGTTARYRNRLLRAYTVQLQYLARELDDTRALTWDQDWSDTLGRAQRQLRRSIQELGGPADTAALAASSGANGRPVGAAAISDWPYLAI
jgi:hypothetical protein